jgi:hypothetical protein
MPRGSWKELTEIEENKIRKEFLLKPIKRLAREIGISNGRVMRFLKREGLIIPSDLTEKRKAESRKKKGDVPFTKGKKQSEYMSQEAIERTKATRFKKGNTPLNTNSIGNGAIVLRKNKHGRKYKYIRTKLSVWELYHRILWEKEKGEIPANHVVAFKDGNSENAVIENLELITMSENMYRNSKENYPREIIPSMVLNKKIESKINELSNG